MITNARVKFIENENGTLFFAPFIIKKGKALVWEAVDIDGNVWTPDILTPVKVIETNISIPVIFKTESKYQEHFTNRSYENVYRVISASNPEYNDYIYRLLMSSAVQTSAQGLVVHNYINKLHYEHDVG